MVIVSAHSGADTSSSYDDALPYPESAASLVAQQVPDIDAILLGHAHKEIAQRYERNAGTGREVLLCETLSWGNRLAVMDIRLEQKPRKRGKRNAKRACKVLSVTCTLLNSNVATEDERVAGAVRAQHDKVVAYVDSPVGTSTVALSAHAQWSRTWRSSTSSSTCRPRP